MTNEFWPDAGEPLPVAPPPPVAPPAPPARRRGRVGFTVAFVVLTLLVVGLGAFSAYLWTVHSQYVAQNQELRDTASELGSELADAHGAALTLEAQLAETKTQLEEAKTRFSDVANSEAQAGDDLQALEDVVNGLQECADARQDLIDHLNEAYRWTPESLAATERSVTQYCDSVNALAREIIDD